MICVTCMKEGVEKFGGNRFQGDRYCDEHDPRDKAAAKPIRASRPTTAQHRGNPNSVAAAHDIALKAGSLREKAYTYLKVHGPHTADEVAEALNENVLSIRPRMTELLQGGYIEEAGYNRDSDLHRPQAVMRIRERVQA